MEDLKPVKSGKVKVDDVNLYYELYGAGDPLVLVAGTGISLAPWRVSQVPSLRSVIRCLFTITAVWGEATSPTCITRRGSLPKTVLV